MADSRCPKYVREGFNELLKWAQYGHEGILIDVAFHVHSSASLYMWIDYELCCRTRQDQGRNAAVFYATEY